MAINLQYRTTRWGTWTTYDIPGNGLALKQLTISYAHATRIDWHITANETSAPIPRLSWVRVWDDTGVDEGGQPQTENNPLFFGRIVDVSPGAHSNQVLYTAFDPTYWASKTVAVMSLPYDIGTIPNSPPQSYVGAVPRLVYNVKNTGDDDYSYQAGQNGTVATIIKGLLEFAYQPLYWLDAAPGDETNAGNNVPYLNSDMVNMDFIPQQKIVWESLTIRAAVEQMWRHEPRFRMLWNPATKRWRFHRITNSTAVTIKLNDTGLSNPHPCVALDIKPSYEDCNTAVSIYGPPSNSLALLYWDKTLGTTLNNTNLMPIGSPVVLQNYSNASGMQTAQFYSKFQIVDTYKRPGSRILPDWIQMGVDQYNTVAIRYPTFQVSWDYNTWIAVSNVFFDFLNGTVTFNGNIPYCKAEDSRGQSIEPNSTQTIFPPVACRLYWSPYLPPLSVRYPATGYAGTAYTVAGLTSEYRLYDESLMIGREYGTPVTSTERIAQYTKLAQYLHETRKDVIYTGQAIMAGIDYSWCRLNKRVNIADAALTTTGWENINAVVTDVEYTFGDTPSTTLSFNGNWQELYGEDPAALRERLRIQTFSQSTFAQMYGLPITQLHFAKDMVENYDGSKNKRLDGITTYNPFVYVDQYGNKQNGNVR